MARLLASPDQEIHALDLVSAERGLSLGSAQPPDSAVALGDAGEILDDLARTAYRQRLEDLAGEVDEARRNNDPERAERLEDERRALVTELSAGYGILGRSRRAGSASERARVSVTKALRAALRHIARNGPTLARHLNRAIATGTYCAYRPDGESHVDWLT